MVELTHYRELTERGDQEDVFSDSLTDFREEDFSAEDFLDRSSERQAKILKDQLEDCREELSERKEIHRDKINELKEKRSEYRASLISKSKLRKFAEGEDFEERRTDMVKRMGTVEEEIRKGKVEKWRDEREIKKEMREIRREIQELEKSYDIMSDFSH